MHVNLNQFVYKDTLKLDSKILLHLRDNVEYYLVIKDFPGKQKGEIIERYKFQSLIFTNYDTYLIVELINENLIISLGMKGTMKYSSRIKTKDNF